MIGYCGFCENLSDTDLESSMTTMKIALVIRKSSKIIQLFSNADMEKRGRENADLESVARLS